jgi:putative intracellular protease/amidase
VASVLCHVVLFAPWLIGRIETAVPWQVFQTAGFDISFATEAGKSPVCDDKMLSGWTGAVLGANKQAKAAYRAMSSTFSEFQHPLSWSDASFSLEEYDLVFLPGGHEKGVRQVIDSPRIHELLANYFPKTAKPSRKFLAAICHGVQVLASATTGGGKSVMHDAETTALPAFFEQGIYHATKLVLGDYYKTYGAGTPSVQEMIETKLDDKAQFKNNLGPSP